MAAEICTKTFPLNNGTDAMPAVGLGTWQGSASSEDEKLLEKSIIHALKSGYRLIDTAQYYNVEHVVGRAVRNSGIPRSDIMVVTKLWQEWHHDPAAALSISLAQLELDYVDIMLMHWPFATTPAPEKKMLRKWEEPTFRDTWAGMEDMVGPRCHAIGLSNFSQTTIDELLETARIIPAVNQVELHAFNPCLKLVPYCQEKGIHVMSWGTMGGHKESNEMHTHDLFRLIADAHGVSTGVVHLSWAVQRGVTVIPMSSKDERIEQNIKLVTLSEDEMDEMNNAHKTIKFVRNAKSIGPFRMVVDGKDTLQGWTWQDFGWEDEEGNDLS
jgi:glycerol 2-dehydrogenase (NADP+)